MRKKAQYFLIAALIIAVIIAGFATIYVSTNTPQTDTSVFDLSNEIDYEASQIIYNGVASGLSQAEIQSRIKTLTAFYAKANPDSDLAIYYGDETAINAIIYEASTCTQFSPFYIDEDKIFFSPKLTARIGNTINLQPSAPKEHPVLEGVNQVSINDLKASLKLIRKENNKLIVELISDTTIRGEIQEFGLEKLGNYYVGLSSLQSEEIEITVITVEAIENTEEAITLIPPTESDILLSPQDVSRICFDFTGSQSTDISIPGRNIEEGILTPPNNKVIVKFGDISEEFDIKQGQNFFLVVKKERSGERTVASNR
jgi:hypothetical protein